MAVPSHAPLRRLAILCYSDTHISGCSLSAVAKCRKLLPTNQNDLPTCRLVSNLGTCHQERVSLSSSTSDLHPRSRICEIWSCRSLPSWRLPVGTRFLAHVHILPTYGHVMEFILSSRVRTQSREAEQMVKVAQLQK